MDIRRMLADLQSERDRIEKAIAALQSLEGTVSAAGTTGARRGRRPGRPPKSASAGNAPQGGGGRRRRRTMSPAARKRISEMMKLRWAERKKKSSK
jgi:hypothetical protein